MMRWIHRNKHSITIVFMVIAVAFAFSGVGINILHSGGGRSQYAAKISDHEFSFADVSRAQRQIEAQYRRMLGPNFNEVVKSFNLNLTQQAVDSLMDSYLMEEKAKSLGFAVSEEQLQEYIVQTFAATTGQPQGFSPQAYAAFVRENGFTPAQYEEYVKSNLVQSIFSGIMADASYPSLKEAKAALEQSDTEYSVVSAEIAPSKLISEVPTPSDDELKKFFESNATDYELPARVSYDYVVFTPADFKASVPVQQQDIEMAYSENKSKYTTPEQAKVKIIKILYPKSSDPVKMAEAKEKANKAYSEAVSGKPFDSLVLAYSEDLPSKATGGSLGWVSPGTQSKAFDASVFKLQGPGVADLIEEDFGFQIAKVEEYKAKGEKSLEEVKSKIEDELKAEEAPAYASAKAHDLKSKFESDKPFAEVAKEASLTPASTSGLLDESKDPAASLAGLTSAILKEADTSKAGVVIVELSDRTVLAKIKENKPAELPGFEEAKPKVVEAYKAEKAQLLAKTKAEELLNAASTSNLNAAASKLKLTLSTPQSIKRSANGTGVLADKAARDAIFKNAKQGTVIPESFKAGDSLYVLEVTGIKRPDYSTNPEKINEYRAQAARQLARATLDSNIERMKAGASPDIDPSILVR